MDDSAILKRRGYIMGINLGEGSYAKVKSAYSERLKFNVAVKIIDRKKAPTDFLEKFLPREIEILPILNHPSIIKTYEIFETSDGKVYIVMELGVQGDLLEFIKTRGALQEDDARKKFHQLSLAIKYCHDLDVVHRDLKCENLLLDKDFNIKLSDFGFSKRCLRDDSGRIILSKTFCGSAAYAAPEVLQGIPYQPKVYDIWSLGVILYIMVCGSMPYDDTNIKKMLRLQKEHRVNFPRSKRLTGECKDLIYRMLQPDVNRRLHIDEILSHLWLQPKGIPYQPKVYDIWSLGVILYIMVCGSMPYDDTNIKKMLRLQKEHRVNFPRSKRLTGECKDLIYRMLQPDVNRRLHIDEILSHLWLQPKAPGLFSAAINEEGESSRGPEPSRTPETPDKKSATKLEPREEAWPETHSEPKPDEEETLQVPVSRQSDTMGLNGELAGRETEEEALPQPSETHT
uniref:non-specific serine/threonine protein kinase n=1 Tax=Ursus americanus TaxID=9643 RepID=A0A452S5D8_URSAM